MGKPLYFSEPQFSSSKWGHQPVLKDLDKGDKTLNLVQSQCLLPSPHWPDHSHVHLCPAQLPRTMLTITSCSVWKQHALPSLCLLEACFHQLRGSSQPCLCLSVPGASCDLQKGHSSHPELGGTRDSSLTLLVSLSPGVMRAQDSCASSRAEEVPSPPDPRAVAGDELPAVLLLSQKSILSGLRAVRWAPRGGSWAWCSGDGEGNGGPTTLT